MKKLFSLMLGLVVALLVCACHSDKQDYRDALPNDALVTAKVELGALLNKSEALQNPQVQAWLLNGSNDLQRAFLSELLSNPESCGIDLTQPLYVAMTSAEPLQGVMVLAIRSKAEFEGFLKAGDITFSEPNQLYYDDQRLVLALDDEAPNAKAYLQLPDERKATADARFEAFFADEKDMALFYDYLGLMQLAASQGAIPMADDESLLAGTLGLLTLHFDNGSIALHAKAKPNGERKNFLEDIVQKATGSHYPLVPANAFAVVNFGIRNLSARLSLLSDDLQEQATSALESLGLTPSDLDTIEGDVTLAATTDVGVVAMIACKDDRLLHAIATIMEMQYRIHPIASGVYESPNLVFGFSDGILFFMNRQYAKRSLNGSQLRNFGAESFVSSRLANRMGDGGLVIDADLLVEALDEFGDLAEIIPLLKSLDNLNASSNISSSEAELNLEFHNQQQNALKQLLDLVLSQTTEE